MSWASAIKARMEKHNVSQQDLAIGAGLSKSYVSELVNGNKSGLSLDKADAVAKVLKTRGWVLWREACKAELNKVE